MLSNREDVNGVTVVLGIGILAAACILARFFSNYTLLNRNVERMRDYCIESQVEVADLESRGGARNDAAGDG